MGLSTQQVSKPIIKSKTEGLNLTTREGFFLHFFHINFAKISVPQKNLQKHI
jgi:hypothetical protein